MRALRPAFRFKVYPTGEFSATRVKETLAIVPKAYGEGRIRALGAIASVYERHHHELPGSTLPTASFVASQISPLGLSKVSKNHKPRKPRGRKGMTRYGKRLIVNSCLLLEKKYGRKHLSFLTLTLPPQCEGGSSDSYQESKRQMLQWLSRRLASVGLPQDVIGCTELQSSRYTNSAAFCLHEHWVFVGRRHYSSWGITPREIQSKWISILCNVYRVSIPEASATAAVSIERVKKAAGAYLGKYMSKSEAVVRVAIENGDIEKLPHSWVSKTRSMLKLFNSSISILNGEDAILWLDYLTGSGSHLCRWKRHLHIEGREGNAVWLAFIGYLSAEGQKEYERYC